LANTKRTLIINCSVVSKKMGAIFPRQQGIAMDNGKRAALEAFRQD